MLACFPEGFSTLQLRFLRTTALALLLTLVGCATPPSGPANPNDPLEASNRAAYAVNDAVDRAVLTPVAKVYEFATPQAVRTCITNMFLNVGEIWSGVNSFLQGRQEDTLTTVGRFLLNTTLGLGCFDWASANGAKRIPNDFGVTLGVWGVPTGPYIVLPLLGASTTRDGLGKIADAYINQVEVGQAIHNISLRNALYGLELVQRREALLGITETLDRTALDPYSFVRDAYLQRRAAQVRGANAEAERLPNYEDFEAAPVDDKVLGIRKP